MKLLAYRIMDLPNAFGCRFEAKLLVEGAEKDVAGAISEHQALTMTVTRAKVLAASLLSGSQRMGVDRDAARWRWLREQSKQVAPVAAVVWQAPPFDTGGDLDTAVDRYVEHDE